MTNLHFYYYNIWQILVIINALLDIIYFIVIIYMHMIWWRCLIRDLINNNEENWSTWLSNLFITFDAINWNQYVIIMYDFELKIVFCVSLRLYIFTRFIWIIICDSYNILRSMRLTFYFFIICIFIHQLDNKIHVHITTKVFVFHLLTCYWVFLCSHISFNYIIIRSI